MSQISTADRTWTGHTDTRVCVPAPPLQISTADTRCLTGTVHGTAFTFISSFVPSRHVGKSARRTTTGPVETHRGGRRLTRDRAYLVSVFLVLRFLVLRAHARSSRVVRGILTEVGACAHQHNGTYLHMRCTLGCSKRCPVTGRDSAAASCVHSTRHSTQ